MGTYKTGWLRLPSDPNDFKERFAWSHVKSIFYDKAKNILLKKKLDDMDGLIADHADAIANKLMTNDAFNTAIADYVTKAMMSSTQVNDANHVPTSSLAYAMQQAITANANAITQLNSDLGKQYWSSLETYNVSVINSWNRGTKSITLPAGAYIIGQRSDVQCLNSIYLDTRIDTFEQELPLYEKTLNIPTTTARNNATEYRSCNNTFTMWFSKETTLYFFCWADSPITIQYEIWAIKIK